MSKRKQKPILSDKIAELIAPRRLLDPEIDSEDETAARAIDYDIDDDLDDKEPAARLSDIRKKNVKLLHDIDAKYHGKVASRKELEMDSDDEIDSDEEQTEIDPMTEKSIGEFSMMLTPKQRIKLVREADGTEEDNKIESASDASEEEDIRWELSYFYKYVNFNV